MKFVIISIIILLIIFLYSACVISSRCSRNEELEVNFDNKQDL